MGRGKRNSGQGASTHAALRPAGFNPDFNPTVSFDSDGSAESSVTIFLPELNLVANGADFASAKEDLVTEVRVYAEHFAASPALQSATNRTQHARLLELVAAADQEGRLEEILFAAPVG